MNKILSHSEGLITEILIAYNRGFSEEDIQNAFSSKYLELEVNVRVLFVKPKGELKGNETRRQKTEEVVLQLISVLNLDQGDIQLETDESEEPPRDDEHFKFQEELELLYLEKRLLDIFKSEVPGTSITEKSLPSYIELLQSSQDPDVDWDRLGNLLEEELKNPSHPSSFFISYSIPIDSYLTAIFKNVLQSLKGESEVSNLEYQAIQGFLNSFNFEQWLQELSEEDSWNSLSIWLRDHFVVLQEEGTELINSLKQSIPLLLESWNQPSIAIRNLAELISDHQGYHIQSTSLPLVGGDIIATPNGILIGKDSICPPQSRNQTYSNTAAQIFKDKLQKIVTAPKGNIFEIGTSIPIITLPLKLGGGGSTWWKEYSAILNGGNTSHNSRYSYSFQPFFHIDLFVTPGPTVNNQTTLYVASMNTSWIYREESYLDELKSDDNLQELESKFIDSLERALDSIARNLCQIEGQPFRIKRLPTGLVINKEKILPLSFNNCLVECTAHFNRIFIPRYTIIDDPDYSSGTDEDLIKNELRDCFKDDFGEKIIFFPYQFSPSGKGALRCSVNVLRRTVP